MSAPAKDPTGALAEFAATLDYNDLPTPVVAMVKRLVLDTLGVGLAATTLGPGCSEAVSVMRDLGGTSKSTIIGHGVKVGAPNAAFANGALAHALNFDPIGADVGHLGVVCLAAPLAAAEAAGRVSGQTFLASCAAACEVTARTTAAIARLGRPPGGKVLAGQLFGYFGAAAGAGRALGLGETAMRDAFGLALMQAAGSMQVVLEGDPPAKAIYGGFPNQAGVQAALLARAGLGAACDALAGPAGVYGLFHDGAFDADALTGGLGEAFLLMEAQFKPWPTSLHAHPFIEAAAEIAGKGLRLSEIEAVEVVGNSHLRAWCEPLEERRRPRNAATAGNSIPFCVAKGLVHGTVTLADLTDDGLRDPVAITVAERTVYRPDDRITGGMVTVVTNDGRRLKTSIEHPLGSRDRPLSDDQLTAKFRDCCGHAVAPLSADGVQELIDLVANLERLDDIGRLAILAGGSRTVPG